MGYLTEKYLKDKSKKYYIYIALDIVLIIVFLIFALTAKGEFDNGAKFILQNVPAYCTNYTLYHETLEHYGLSTRIIGNREWGDITPLLPT